MPAKDNLIQRLATLEHHVNENFFEIQRRLDELLKFEDRVKTNFLDVERKLVEFEQKIGEKPPQAPTPAPAEVSDVSRLEEKIKSLEDMLMLLELEVVRAKERHPPAAATPELQVTPHVPTEFEDRLKTLEGKFSAIEKLKLKVPVELIQHEPRLKSIEENVLSTQRKVREEISRLENMISGRAVTEQSAERFVEKMREEMNDLRRDIEKAELLKHEIVEKERLFATRPDLEEFEARIRSEVTGIHNISDRIAAAEKSLDTKLVDIEDMLREEAELLKHEIVEKERLFATRPDLEEFEARIRSEVTGIHNISDRIAAAEKSLDTKLVDIEDMLREEAETHRRAFDSKIVDLEERITKVAAETATAEARKDVEAAIGAHRKDINELVSAMQAELARIKPILTAEKVAALMQRVNTIERDLESRATAVVTKELASFSEAIDRKFPDLVSKSEFVQWSRAIAQRIQTIEAPDISPLADRIDKLELRLNELTALIKEIAVRMPIVVE